MVVQQHFALPGNAWQGEHLANGATRDGPGGGNDAVPVHFGDERDFTPACRRDFGGEEGANARGDAIGQVFSSFFLAAGKSTLLRISR
jgi:hypothetical protein